MNQKNKNVLKKNMNDWAIFSIINNTKLNEYPVVGWKIIGGTKITVDVKFHIIRKFREEIVIRVESEKFKDELINLAANGQKLNFYLPNDLVLFQTEVKHIETNGDVRIKFPQMIAQVDRRKSLRLFLDEGKKVSLDFEKSAHGQLKRQTSFNKNCFDISSTGCSFIIKKSEKNFFRQGDKISKIRLSIGKSEIICNATVINSFEEKPNERNELLYEGWKVSMKFHFKNEADQKLIDDYVFRYVDFSDVI